ncbi:uncharacterized protein KD926_008495 [Aspergillus affinis]|uniref:uncharacterized protein n=1 Tax=Aspergillus affinis TaxID=1070780 RepID=UPI0022FEEB3F|nr:uncharacterized protein KD926_008495 [Aspergillus affinis]KAI9040172.1 hypothetical protein KD926_008495 [Aspergillus affinis]
MDQTCTPKPLLDFIRSRRDLLDHPLLWTSRHLESPGCLFDDVETSTYSESTPQDSKYTDDTEALARNLSPKSKLHCIYNILLREGRRFSRLLVTNVIDQESLLLCEAEITTDLLDALGNLKTAEMPLTWPTIHRKMIPYKPLDTFVGRLMDELVAPSSSDSPKHVNDSTSSETKRCHKKDDGEEYSGPGKIRRIPDA